MEHRRKKNRKSVFLKRRYRPSTFILFIALIFLLIILFRKFAFFLILTSLAGAFVYLNYYIRLPFDVSPVLFLSLVISREYSFLASFLFIVFAGVLPMVLAGGSFDHTTLFYVSVRLLVNFLNSLIRGFPFIPVAIAFSVLDHLIGSIGSLTFGVNLHKEIANFFTQLFVDIVYIMTFSGIVIGLIN